MAPGAMLDLSGNGVGHSRDPDLGGQPDAPRRSAAVPPSKPWSAFTGQTMVMQLLLGKKLAARPNLISNPGGEIGPGVPASSVAPFPGWYRIRGIGFNVWRGKMDWAD